MKCGCASVTDERGEPGGRKIRSHDCQKPFEATLTLTEYEKGNVACPTCGAKHVHQEAAAFFAVTSKKS